MKMTPSEIARSLEYAARLFARDEAVHVGDMAIRRDPEEDSLYIQLRIDQPAHLAELSIDGGVLEVGDAKTVVELFKMEFERSCAVARGRAVAALLKRPVNINDEKREELCDRLTGLIMTLARKDARLCEVLSLKLMEHVERIPR